MEDNSGDFEVTSSTETPEQVETNLQVGNEPELSESEKSTEPEKQEPEPQADGDDGEAPEPIKSKERHSSPVARMKQATAEAAAAKREAEEYRQRAQAQEAELEELRRRATPPQGKPKTDDEPTEEQFETYRDYVKAQARWEARQEFAAQQQAAVERHRKGQISQAAQARVASFQAQVESEGEGFLDKLSPEVLKVDPDSLLGHSITSSPMATKVMKYLSDNPERFQALSGLHPALAIREIGRIEGELRGVASAGTAPRAVSVSRAKPPVRPVAGQPNVGDELSDDASFEDFVKHENAKERARLH